MPMLLTGTEQTACICVSFSKIFLLTSLQIHDPRFPQTETKKSRSRLSISMDESESSSESEDEEDETQGWSSENHFTVKLLLGRHPSVWIFFVLTVHALIKHYHSWSDLKIVIIILFRPTSTKPQAWKLDWSIVIVIRMWRLTWHKQNSF